MRPERKTYTQIYKDFHGQNRDPVEDMVQLLGILVGGSALIGLYYLWKWAFG